MSDVRSAYREAAVQGARPVQLVVLLYEQVLEDLRRACSALQSGDIAGRTREINHALTVLAHLQATLDMEKGGEVATNLQRFYSMVRAELVEAQRTQSLAKLQEQIACISTVLEAWMEVDRISAAPPSSATRPATSDGAPENSPKKDWSA